MINHGFRPEIRLVFPHSHEIRLKGKDDDSPWLSHRFWLKFLWFYLVLTSVMQNDSIIFGDQTVSVNKLLKAIEPQFQKLRQHHPPLRRHPQSSFAHCSAVPQQRQAVYVGTILTDAADNKKGIQNGLALANKTYVQLKLFWDKANTNTNMWKLRAFNSVINSKCLIWARNTPADPRRNEQARCR